MTNQIIEQILEIKFEAQDKADKLARAANRAQVGLKTRLSAEEIQTELKKQYAIISGCEAMLSLSAA